MAEVQKKFEKKVQKKVRKKVRKKSSKKSSKKCLKKSLLKKFKNITNCRRFVVGKIGKYPFVCLKKRMDDKLVLVKKPKKPKNEYHSF
jgi:hypothetical protein